MQYIDTVWRRCSVISDEDGLCRLELAVLGALLTVIALLLVFALAQSQ